jgi:hypothetical protein
MKCQLGNHEGAENVESKGKNSVAQTSRLKRKESAPGSFKGHDLRLFRDSKWLLLLEESNPSLFDDTAENRRFQNPTPITA